jgi:hypothetical protein
MRKILGWCEANQVPVMAHTNLSNGVTQEFEALAGAQFWDMALQAYSKLRVNFGHFGDTAPVEDGLTRARDFAGLMRSGRIRDSAEATTGPHGPGLGEPTVLYKLGTSPVK